MKYVESLMHAYAQNVKLIVDKPMFKDIAETSYSAI